MSDPKSKTPVQDKLIQPGVSRDYTKEEREAIMREQTAEDQRIHESLTQEERDAIQVEDDEEMPPYTEDDIQED